MMMLLEPNKSILSYRRISHLCLILRETDFNLNNIQMKAKKLGSKGLSIIHHHDYVSELPPKHRFAMKKFHGVLKFLRKDNLISMKQVVQPEPINEEVASSVHTKKYCHDFFTGQTTNDEQRRTGFVWSPGLVRRVQLETGGSLLAAALAQERGLACSTAGGTHHAHPEFGSGFCLLNDLAIVARQLTVNKSANRVLIVDLDVHQVGNIIMSFDDEVTWVKVTFTVTEFTLGDGTAVIFQKDPSVFTFSMHAEKNFPYRKQTSDLDIGLPDGTEDDTYMRTLYEHLPSIMSSFRPDIVLYNAGVDPHFDDELGRLNLTDTGLFTRDYYVLSTCVKQGIPCATVIGGGYSRDIQKLSLRHTIVHRAAIKVWLNQHL